MSPPPHGDYGPLSKTAHPTYEASQNSAVLAARLVGFSDDSSLQVALEDSESAPDVWLGMILMVLKNQSPELASLPICEANLPRCNAFFEGHLALLRIGSS